MLYHTALLIYDSIKHSAQEEVMDAFGINKVEFETSIMRNQQSPELMQVLQHMQVTLILLMLTFRNI